ncbi:hypothetical protein EE612_037457 [Oryza sativa]|nr:hypothetical protein EE612_037457 [Oryza sativa]
MAEQGGGVCWAYLPAELAELIAAGFVDGLRPVPGGVLAVARRRALPAGPRRAGPSPPPRRAVDDVPGGLRPLPGPPRARRPRPLPRPLRLRRRRTHPRPPPVPPRPLRPRLPRRPPPPAARRGHRHPPPSPLHRRHRRVPPASIPSPTSSSTWTSTPPSIRYPQDLRRRRCRR